MRGRRSNSALFWPPLFFLPFVFATVSSKQISTEGTEAGTKKSATIEANWAIRCKATIEHNPFRSTSYFLKLYRRLLHRWQQSKTPGIRLEQLSAFLDLLMSLQRGDSGNRPQLEPTPPTPSPTKAQLRAKRRLERKMRSLHKLIAHLDSIDDQGYILVFIDGSPECFEGLGYVGGYGVFSNLPVSLSAPVPLHMKQTINTAELRHYRLYDFMLMSLRLQSVRVQNMSSKGHRWQH